MTKEYRALFMLGTSVRYRPPMVDLVSEFNPFYGAAARRRYEAKKKELQEAVNKDKYNQELAEKLKTLPMLPPRDPDYGIVETLGFVASLINKNNTVSVRLKEDNTMLEKLEYYQHRLNDNVDVVDGVDGVGSEVYSRIAVGLAKILMAIHEGKKDIPIIGFSRGSVEAVIITHELARIKQVLNNIKDSDSSATLINNIINSPKIEIRLELRKYLQDIFGYMREPQFIKNLNNANFNLLIVDPVPGTGMGITWDDERFTTIPDIVNHSVEYAYANEHTLGFYAIIPTGKNSEVHILPGQHGTGSGNFNDQKHMQVPRDLGQTIHVQELMVLNQLLFLKQHGVAFEGEINPVLKQERFGGFALRKRYSNAPILNEKIEDLAYDAPRVFGGYILNCRIEKKGKLTYDVPESISYYDHLTREEIKIVTTPKQLAALQQHFTGDYFKYPVSDDTLNAIQTILGSQNLHYKSNLIPMVEEFMAHEKDPVANPFDANAHYLRIYSEILKNKKAYEHYNNTSYGAQSASEHPVTKKRNRWIFHKTRQMQALEDVFPEYTSEHFLNESHAQIWLNHHLGIAQDMSKPELIKTIVDSLISNTVVDPTLVNSPKGDHHIAEITNNLKKLTDENIQKLFNKAIVSIIERLSDDYLNDAESNSKDSNELFSAVEYAITRLSTHCGSQAVATLYLELNNSLQQTLTNKVNLLMQVADELMYSAPLDKPNTEGEKRNEYNDMMRLSQILNCYQRVQKLIVDLKKFSLIKSQDFAINNLRQKLENLERRREVLFELAKLEIKQQNKEEELKDFLEQFEQGYTNTSLHNVADKEAEQQASVAINPHQSFKNIDVEAVEVDKANKAVGTFVDSMHKNHFARVAASIVITTRLKQIAQRIRAKKQKEAAIKHEDVVNPSSPDVKSITDTEAKKPNSGLSATKTPVSKVTTTNTTASVSPPPKPSKQPSIPVVVAPDEIVRQLKNEVDRYMAHLKNAALRIDPSYDLECLEQPAQNPRLQKIYNKYYGIWDLARSTLGENPNVNDFTKGLKEISGTLNKHRDIPWVRFVKNCCSILGIVATGILPYLVYVGVKGKSPGFFTKSQGKQLVEKIEKIVGPEKKK